MKATRLHAVTTVALIAVSLSALPAIVAGQACPPLARGERPPELKHPTTPKVLIPTIHLDKTKGPGDGKLAADFGFALRARLALLTNDKELWVIQCQVYDTAMAKSGYMPDSALKPIEFANLGQYLSATESIDGTIWRAPDGQTHVAVAFYYQNRLNVREPLPEVVGKDYDDVADKVAKLYLATRKELDPYVKCSNLSRDRKGDSALAYARLAQTVNPGGNLPRQCMLNAWSVVPNAPADSLIAAAQAVYAADSTSKFAVGMLAYAYGQKGDRDNQVRWSIKHYDMDHSDRAAAQTAIDALAQSGAPDKALPIIDQQLTTTPRDTALLSTKVIILLDAQRFKEAFPVFDSLLKADTSIAFSTGPLLRRMIGAAQRDSSLQDELRYRERDTEKHADDAEAWEGYADALFKAGEFQKALKPAKRAVAVDPKVPNGFGFVFTLYRRLNQPDSAIAYAPLAVKAGADPSVVGLAMVGVIVPYAAKADTLMNAKDPGAKDAWQATMNIAAKIDSIVPGTATKFYIGLSAAQMGLIGLQGSAQLGELAKTNKAEACKQMADIDNLLTLAQVNITAGGSFDKTAAGSVMTLVMTAQPQLQAYKTSICK